MTADTWVTIGTVIIALSAVGLAWWRINVLINGQSASVLDRLNERWLTAPLLEARQISDRLRRDVMATTSNPNDQQEECRRILWQWEKTPTPDTTEANDYATLRRLCDFFESMGWSVKAGYLPLKDVTEVFGGSIIRNAELFQRHLKELEEAKNEPKLYEHFIWLAGKVKRKVKRT